MEKITQEEAHKIAHRYAPFEDAEYARKMYSDIFHQKFMSEEYEYDWAHRCAAAAVYQAGRINGIREERERRRTGKRRPKEE